MSRDKRGVVNPVIPGSSPGATAKFVICCVDTPTALHAAFVALTLVDRTLLEQRAQVGSWRNLGHLRHTVRDVEVARDLRSVIRGKVAPPKVMSRSTMWPLRRGRADR